MLLRAHRIRLLADAAADRRTVDLWHASEPHNPDAAVLRAETEVMRMFGAARGTAFPGVDSLDRTAGLCRQAAALAPADPQPWVALLALGRLYPGGHPHINDWWKEISRRDPYHREGHHQALRYLSARWHGSYGAALNFAWDAVGYAPDGSPLLIRPQVARAEQYRHRRETEQDVPLGINQHWSDERAQWDLRTAMTRWIAHRTTPGAAQDVADLNTLAHGLALAGMLDEAGELFRLLDNRATVAPWSYTGDADRLFAHWRDRTATG